MFTKPYDTKALAALSKKTAYYSEEETLTQQQFMDEADINTMIRRFTQNPSQTPQQTQGMYLDHTQLASLSESQDTQIQLDNEFNNLPSLVRAKFKNSSQNYAEHLIAQSDLKTNAEKEDYYKKMTSPIKKQEDQKIHAAAELLIAERNKQSQTPPIINQAKAQPNKGSTDKA